MVGRGALSYYALTPRARKSGVECQVSDHRFVEKENLGYDI